MPNSNEYMRTYVLARYHRLRSEAIDSLGGTCIDCGATEPLEFDHVDPKEKLFTIGCMWSRSAKAIEAELAKCVLRCRNCHRKRTSAQQSVEHGGGKTGKKNCYCELCKPLKLAYAREYKKERRTACA